MTGAKKTESGFLRQAQSCVRCGACQAVCPLYRIGRREELSARGKLGLIRHMERKSWNSLPELSSLLDLCLSCGRCTANCPNQVAASRAILEARSALNQSRGSLNGQAMRWLLGEKARIKMAMGAAKGVLWLGARAYPWQHLRGRLDITGPAFLDEAPREVRVTSKGRRIGIFVGCMANYMRTQLMDKLLYLLSARFELVIPPEQGCCGLPAISAGLPELAVRAAASSLRAFKQAGVEMVVTVCGSCAYMFRCHLPRIMDNAVFRDLAAGVKEVTELLAEESGKFRGVKANQPDMAVEVHHPCHMKIGLDAHQQTMAVMRKAGVPLNSEAGIDSCCGGGGVFSVKKPELSGRVFASAHENLEASGAALLATTCNGCFLQWALRSAKTTSIVHPIELMAW